MFNLLEYLIKINKIDLHHTLESEISFYFINIRYLFHNIKFSIYRGVAEIHKSNQRSTFHLIIHTYHIIICLLIITTTLCFKGISFYSNLIRIRKPITTIKLIEYDEPMVLYL